MWSFYLQIRIYVIEKWPFFWNLSSNLQWSLVFLYENSLYASLFLESLSRAYNEVHLYFFVCQPMLGTNDALNIAPMIRNEYVTIGQSVYPISETICQYFIH